ncbi:uncharacterized protein BYT42DRAFT_561066 [Radiomyces spectabilis]|uniref:uncharacterized protein n=1 Tax=Radiomyces spectabilis TaxID=64574 RepID=UPI00221F9433|nr:uncharacterized protein BYT42DRAFT_561066 [Radiomyces spectabilis]KAI8388741.1 hypothetical protein BYT42DRAFT_561066 [Radiomyces spectabilis]
MLLHWFSTWLSPQEYQEIHDLNQHEEDEGWIEVSVPHMKSSANGAAPTSQRTLSTLSPKERNPTAAPSVTPTSPLNLSVPSTAATQTIPAANSAPFPIAQKEYSAENGQQEKRMSRQERRLKARTSAKEKKKQARTVLSMSYSKTGGINNCMPSAKVSVSMEH